MKRVRVLSVVNTLYFGGAECRLLSLSKGIDTDRFDQTVLTLKRIDPAYEREFGSLRPHFAAANIEVQNLNEAAPTNGQRARHSYEGRSFDAATHADARKIDALHSRKSYRRGRYSLRHG